MPLATTCSMGDSYITTVPGRTGRPGAVSGSGRLPLVDFGDKEGFEFPVLENVHNQRYRDLAALAER